MRIKLIFPARKMRNLEIRGKNHLIPSETLTTLAAVTPPQHEVTIEDENVQRLHLDDQPDVVGITVYTFLARRAYEIADQYRAKGVYVVLGGRNSIPGSTSCAGYPTVPWSKTSASWSSTSP